MNIKLAITFVIIYQHGYLEQRNNGTWTLDIDPFRLSIKNSLARYIVSIIVVERGEHLLMANKKSDVSTLLSALTTHSSGSKYYDDRQEHLL